MAIPFVGSSMRLEGGSMLAASLGGRGSPELGEEGVPVEIFDRAKAYEHQEEARKITPLSIWLKGLCNELSRTMATTTEAVNMARLFYGLIEQFNSRVSFRGDCRSLLCYV